MLQLTKSDKAGTVFALRGLYASDSVCLFHFNHAHHDGTDCLPLTPAENCCEDATLRQLPLRRVISPLPRNLPLLATRVLLNSRRTDVWRSNLYFCF